MSEDSSDDGGPAATRRWRPHRRAVLISLLFHAVLIVILLLWYVPHRRERRDSPPVSASSVPTESGPPSPDSEPSAPSAAETSPDVPREQIEASIRSQVRQVEKLSDERKLAELEKNLKRLESLSTEESVREVTATIAGSLGLQPGAVPREDADRREGLEEGTFDADTAQIHDVIRSRSPSGAWDYQSVLVDAQGRTRTVPMGASEGETVYNAFQKMKQFPMAAGIYRQVVMPMIQKMIEAGKVAEQVAAEAEKTTP